MSNPEVSVLVPCYNASRWLPEAIDSVLAQTFENLELVLVNDGSTDETWNIIQSFRQRDERIVALSKENTGVADSLNVGLARARGVWIARLDADDLCEPTRLEEQMHFARSHSQVVLLGTGFTEIDLDGRVIKKHQYPASHSGLVWQLEHLGRFFPHSSAFYRRDVVRRIGGYNHRICRAEDHWLWLELSLQGEIACLPRPLVRIRKHSGQLSSTQSRRQIYDAILADVCHFLHMYGWPDPSKTYDDAAWTTFVAQIDQQLMDRGIFERRDAWGKARDAYFAADNRLLGTLRFGASLLASGHAAALMRDKLFGSALPQQVAWERIEEARRTTHPKQERMAC